MGLLGCRRRRPIGSAACDRIGAIKGKTPLALCRAIALMNENLEQPLSASEVARRIGTCPRHLQRIFLQYFRLAPSRFYQNHRLQCARRLIRQTSMTVTEIGMATGFKTTSHFSESGRAETGCPAAAPLANSSVHEILRQAHWPHQIWRRHRLGWHRSRSAWGQTEPLDQGEDRSGSPPTAALSCCRSIGCDVPEPATCLQSGFACQVARPSQNSIYAKS